MCLWVPVTNYCLKTLCIRLLWKIRTKATDLPANSSCSCKYLPSNPKSRDTVCLSRGKAVRHSNFRPIKFGAREYHISFPTKPGTHTIRYEVPSRTEGKPENSPFGNSRHKRNNFLLCCQQRSNFIHSSLYYIGRFIK